MSLTSQCAFPDGSGVLNRLVFSTENLGVFELFREALGRVTDCGRASSTRASGFISDCLPLLLIQSVIWRKFAAGVLSPNTCLGRSDVSWAALPIVTTSEGVSM